MDAEGPQMLFLSLFCVVVLHKLFFIADSIKMSPLSTPLCPPPPSPHLLPFVAWIQCPLIITMLPTKDMIYRY